MTRYNELFQKISQDQLIDLDEMARNRIYKHTGINGIINLFTSPNELPHSIRVKYYPNGRGRGEISCSLRWDKESVIVEHLDKMKVSDFKSSVDDVIKWMNANKSKIIKFSLHAWKWDDDKITNFVDSMKKLQDI